MARLKFALFRCTLFVLAYACHSFSSAKSSDDIMEARQSADPCVDIAGKTYVVPSQLLSCLTSFPFNTTLRDNIVEVVSKSLNFDTSINYQRAAPAPFTDVHEDVQGQLARIGTSEYSSDYALHLDVSSQVKLLYDGHCTYINYCYDSLYTTYLPFPVVNLNSGSDLSQQDIYIAPEAYNITATEFPDFIDQWQTMAGYNFSKYVGAKVLAIDGADPWTAVEINAVGIGGWQGRSSRENSFFSSYTLDSPGWSYRFGDFALRSLPPSQDTVNMTVLPLNATNPETIVVPFISQIATYTFTNATDLWASNCVAGYFTNGDDIFFHDSIGEGGPDSVPVPVLSDPAPHKFAPSIPPGDRNYPISSVVDMTAFVDAALPPTMQPTSPVSTGGTAQFFVQGNVGILALGSFSTGADFDTWFELLDNGFKALKAANVTHLIVDVTNNGGGYTCVANWLHRYLAGPKNSTEPQAGFDTKMRYNALASNMTQYIVDGGAPLRGILFYDPVHWDYGNSSGTFPSDYNFLEPPVRTTINGQADAFSQRLGNECGTSYPTAPPDEPYLPAENIGIVSNGRCASSCAIFSITMAKKEGAKTAVVGGRNTTAQQYTGTVGGQSTDFVRIDSEIKTTQLKNDTLAPPDFLGNCYQGLTFRLAFGITDPEQPEEWQDHQADLNLPLTFDTVNNPAAIWKALAARWWPELS